MPPTTKSSEEKKISYILSSHSVWQSSFILSPSNKWVNQWK